MRNRWRLLAAVTGSLLLHALVLFGFAGGQAPARFVGSGNAPIRAYLISSAPVAEDAPQPAKEMAPAKKIALRPRVESRSSSRPLAPQLEIAVTSPLQPVYRPGAELDTPPRPLEEIDPEYPEAAGMKEGVVVLRLFIGATGNVDELAVISASPEGLFEASALTAFGKARFSPGRHLGLPVSSQITIEVEYTPINRGGDVSGHSGLGIRR